MTRINFFKSGIAALIAFPAKLFAESVCPDQEIPFEWFSFWQKNDTTWVISPHRGLNSKSGFILTQFSYPFPTKPIDVKAYLAKDGTAYIIADGNKCTEVSLWDEDFPGPLVNLKPRQNLDYLQRWGRISRSV